MKRTLSIFLIILMLFTFVACSQGKVEPVTNPEATTQAPTEAPTPTPTTIPTEEITPTPTLLPTATPVPTATVGPVDLAKYTTFYVSGSVVNVREGASTSTKKITSLPVNSTVKSYKQIDGWHYISYDDNRFGFMAGDYLSKNPVATPTPAPTRAPLPDFKPNNSAQINDNVFLDALEYTGYNLKKHKADGNMWVFILGKYKQGLGYLSGLGYDYGASTGYETNAQGKPDIAGFKKRGGLVCASYLTYVYFNYLPNVAGIDTSHLTRPEYPCSAQSWRLAANDWVKKGYSRKISFTAKRYSSGVVSFTPSETIPVGSIVVFKVYGASDSSQARHVSIYAGYAGGYHWLTHVGNERGPEMITVENMGFGSTAEIPVEVITCPIKLS
ncbi:MAG: hypothetical protein E7365_07170 [Clostridiales bacterium]|nr:hypothetical protein [Clostridiales bacterium]